jgi:hypothetical protein
VGNVNRRAAASDANIRRVVHFRPSRRALACVVASGK